MKWLLKRIIFYTITISIGSFIFWKANLQLEGKNASTFFLSFSLVSGTLQSINIWLLKKITDFDKIPDLGFWARQRLENKLEERREAAFSRAAIGFCFSLIIGICAAYMKIIDTESIPFWILGLASTSVLICIIMFFTTLFESYLLTKLESDLIKREKDSKVKSEATTSLTDSKEKDN
ncbi:hypothetical protein HXX02_04840 [Microbulbifer elongatus]|uniref:DUF2721 domain-containing protein n=1 Tax=Microbulbifer elongatus TaxID=86173 RepID=A0ABT1NXZ5_9GAMM|nr:hypothetical protein [Microbulbifer elongatus]MCQ3828760.1 hypothetical protein [Microbulbifer elongatus]